MKTSQVLLASKSHSCAEARSSSTDEASIACWDRAACKRASALES